MNIKSILYIVKFTLLEPRFFTLTWELKRNHKTFLSWEKLFSLVASYHKLRRRWPKKHLHLTEFGVGRGGSATLLAALVGRYGGSITLFDVFGQIPAPTATDGEQAQKRFDKIIQLGDKEYYGNIPNLVGVVRQEINRVCPQDRIEIVQGRYEEVLPTYISKNTFDLVHIDCDWYESSKAVLAYLQSHLSPRAILQIDDYRHWQGSRQAFDEAAWLKPYRSRRVDDALRVDTGIGK